MPNTFVIVESPHKGKRIGQILGRGYTVKASTGHVCDLPEDEIGVSITSGFQEHYVLTKPNIIAELRQAARCCRTIVLATDPDREGEAIAWHIARLIAKDKPVTRVTFNQITSEAVRQAFANPGPINQAMVDAQRARRVIDRLIGYLISPILSQVGAGSTILSAGRVQTAALRIVVERDRQRRDFNAQIFQVIDAYLLYREHSLQARLVDPPSMANQHDVDTILNHLSHADAWWVEDVIVTDKTHNPPPPFITSTLQQEASRCLQYEPHQTDQAAQLLFDVGAITYPRSDSTHVAIEAQIAARSVIKHYYDSNYLPEQSPHYPTRHGAQGAHEAIRPVHPDRPLPDEAQDHLDLYTLIWQRFIASQMAPARLQTTHITIRAGSDQHAPLPYCFAAQSQQLIFPGYRALYDDLPDIDEVREQQENELPQTNLPPLVTGALLQLDRLTAPQKQTRPPHRYTTARLIAALDRRHIGRPSTFGSICRTLQERGYLTSQHRYLAATPLGEQVLDLLMEYFPDIFDLSFTATIETLLDRIAQGETTYKAVVGAFYFGTLKPALDAACRQSNQPLRACPLCGGLLQRHNGRHGPFWGCSRYPDCSYTESLTLLPVKETA